MRLSVSLAAVGSLACKDIDIYIHIQLCICQKTISVYKNKFPTTPHIFWFVLLMCLTFSLTACLFNYLSSSLLDSSNIAVASQFLYSVVSASIWICLIVTFYCVSFFANSIFFHFIANCCSFFSLVQLGLVACLYVCCLLTCSLLQLGTSIIITTSSKQKQQTTSCTHSANVYC